jgi:hypothetical protein
MKGQPLLFNTESWSFEPIEMALHETDDIDILAMVHFDSRCRAFILQASIRCQAPRQMQMHAGASVPTD